MNKSISVAIRTAIATTILITVSGCSTMKATNSGFLTEQITIAPTASEKISVSWLVDKSESITDKEKDLLTERLVDALYAELSTAQKEIDLSTVHIRAAITRVETVNEPINWLSTALVFLPLDRGGIAVEFEAVNRTSKLPITQLNFAQWVPMTEFLARFDRMAPAEIALASSAKTFIAQLQENLIAK